MTNRQFNFVMACCAVSLLAVCVKAVFVVARFLQ
jgi:hypothetical protein